MEDTLEWEMLTTLMKRVQKNDELEQKEKNRRFDMLLAWWKKNSKKFKRLNKRVKIKNIKNKCNLYDIILQFHYIHTLRLAYKGIEKQKFNKTNFTAENAEKSMKEDEQFFKNLIAEIKETYLRLEEFNKQFNKYRGQ